MKTFQKIFDSKLDELKSMKTLIRKVLRAKLDVSDIEIETITNKFVEFIEKNDDTATMEINDGTDKKIEITDEDIEKVGREITDNFEKAYPKVIKETSNHVLKIIDRDSPSTLKLHREDREGFENRLKDTWKKAFDVFESFLLLVNDSGREFNDEYRPDAIIENDVVFDTLIRLHVRACQIGNEIFTLIRTGYADGSHARWRTLHEVTVIAMFISKHGKYSVF